MMFRRRFQPEPESKPVCFHAWAVADFRIIEIYNGIDVDFVDFYEIGCEKCGTKREIDELTYHRMLRRGFIKDRSDGD